MAKGFVYDNDFYTAVLNEKGDWAFKSKSVLTKKKKVRDEPQYNVIYQYEGAFKKQFAKKNNQMIKIIHQKLLTFQKK